MSTSTHYDNGYEDGYEDGVTDMRIRALAKSAAAKQRAWAFVPGSEKHRQWQAVSDALDSLAQDLEVLPEEEGTPAEGLTFGWHHTHGQIMLSNPSRCERCGAYSDGPKARQPCKEPRP